MSKSIYVFLILLITFSFGCSKQTNKVDPTIANAEILQKSDLIVSRSFHDEFTGNDFFNLQMNKTIYFNNTDKKWYQIDGNFRFIFMYKGDRYPEVSDVPGQAFDFSTYFLDVNKKRIFKGNNYNISPDGKWGFLQKRYSWSIKTQEGWYQSWDVHGILIKNFSNGNIEQPFESVHWINIRWINDNTLLICKYSNDAKQNEIGIYYPKSKTYKRIVLGTLNEYFDKTNLIYFVKNELSRRPWILDLNSNKERLIAEYSEIEKLRADVINQPDPTLPKKLDPKNIKPLKFTFEEQYEHKLIVNGQTIKIPYIFKKNHKTFIPLRPLFKPLNIKYKIINPSQENYQYELVYNGKKFIINRNNSIIYQWRLYLTPQTLNSIGLKNLLIKPNKDLLLTN